MTEHWTRIDQIVMNGMERKEKGIDGLRQNPFDPRAYTDYWQGEFYSKKLDVHIPDCDWTENEIAVPTKDIYGKETQGVMIYLPEELMGNRGFVRLIEMYPQVKSSSFDKNTRVRDIHETTGWIKGYSTSDKPNLDTTQEQLEDFAKQEDYLGGRLRTYILISRFMKNLTGIPQRVQEAFRLPGSYDRDRGGMVIGAFGLDGEFQDDFALSPKGHKKFIGGWLEQVKKT